jgi:hypothetical protein
MEEKCTLQILLMMIKSRRWAGHIVCMGEMRNAFKNLVGKLEGVIPLGRPRYR